MPNKTKSIGFGSPFQLPDDFVITTDRKKSRGVLTPIVAENLFWSLNPPKNYYISKRKFHRIVNLQKINLFHFPAIYSVSLLSSYSQSQVNPYAGRLSQCYSWLPPCDYCQHPSLHVGRSRYKAWNHCRRVVLFHPIHPLYSPSRFAVIYHTTWILTTFKTQWTLNILLCFHLHHHHQLCNEQCPVAP